MHKRREAAQLPDENLVAIARQQLPYRTTAYEELMRRHRTKLYYLCLRIVRQSDDAEDVVQEVMLKVFHGLKGFSRQSKFSTWLYSIASNACLDHLRKHAAQQRHTGYLDEANEPYYLSQDDDRILAEKALASLGDRDRTMMALYYTTGLTLDEIAVVMNMKLSAAKMRYYRALEKLRKQFGESPDDKKHQEK